MNSFEWELLKTLSKKPNSAIGVFGVLDLANEKKSYYHISRTLRLLEVQMYLQKEYKDGSVVYKLTTDGKQQLQQSKKSRQMTLKKR